MREALGPIFENDRLECERELREQSFCFRFVKQYKKLFSLLFK